MNKQLFGDGNDAIAWAAQDSDVAYVSHYPGSPVNRVIDVMEKSLGQQQEAHQDYKINHALNEHIAALSTLGASLCGARSLLVMKHVGLNIAADPLNYSAVIKIKGEWSLSSAPILALEPVLAKKMFIGMHHSLIYHC